MFTEFTDNMMLEDTAHLVERVGISIQNDLQIKQRETVGEQVELNAVLL